MGGGDLIVQLRHPVLDGPQLRPGGGRNLVKARPPHRIGPAAPHCAGALVAWSGRGPLAAEGVASLQAPQSPVVPQPRRRIVDEHRAPAALLTGTYAQAVPSAVVNERDAERGALAGSPRRSAGPAGRRRRTGRCLAPAAPAPARAATSGIHCE